MVLLVGATGRLGSRIARELLASRTPLRVLCRRMSGHAVLRRMGADVRFGDLRDQASVDAACEGIDTVLSTASAVSRGGDDTVDAVDDAGTRRLFDRAASRGVTRIVSVSAMGATPSSPVPLLAAKGALDKRGDAARPAAATVCASRSPTPESASLNKSWNAFLRPSNKLILR